MKINLPFREEFRDRMLSGRKTCTSRTKRFGEGGDTFEAFEAEFILERNNAGLNTIAVDRFPLSYVAKYFFGGEGFDTTEDFIECWKKIHPRKGYDPEQKVWVHYFRRSS